MKYIKEFFFFFNKPKVGDELSCKKECGYSGAYKQLPRLYDFEIGKEYKVVDVSDNSVTLESDQETHFSDKTSTQIFSLEEGNRDFLYLWDFFDEK